VLVVVELLLALAEVDGKRVPVGIAQVQAVISFAQNRRTQGNQSFGLDDRFRCGEMEPLPIRTARRAI
jgi:hypothetical protein